MLLIESETPDAAVRARLRDAVMEYESAREDDARAVRMGEHAPPATGRQPLDVASGRLAATVAAAGYAAVVLGKRMYVADPLAVQTSGDAPVDGAEILTVEHRPIARLD